MPTQSQTKGLILVGIVVASVLIGGFVLTTQPNEPVTGDAVWDFEIGSVGSGHADGVLRISADVTNLAPATQTGTISLKLDQDGDGTFETTVERREVAFESGERRVIAFEQSTEKMSSGTYQYGVFAGGENTATEQYKALSVDIQQPPQFGISEVPENTAVVKGEMATVSFHVTNAGDESRSRIVSLLVDSNGDDTFDSAEEAAVQVLELEANQEKTVWMLVPTATLDAGTYTFQVQTETDSKQGVLTVLRPASFDVEFTSIPENVTKGEPLNASVKLTNTGEVSGATTLTVGPANGTQNITQTITLAPGEETTRNVSVATENVSRGDTVFVAAVESANDSATVYVKSPVFEVSRLSHTKTAGSDGDESIQVEARITNTGDIAGKELVRLQIDIDGDDRPERVGINESMRLDVGERKTVTFEISTEFSDDDVSPKLTVGTYIYGVFTDDEGKTDVFAVKKDTTRGPGGSSADDGSTEENPSDDSSDTEPTQYATRDEISQSKYGMYFDELSGETRDQVVEIHARQAFADGYAVTDVLTREELARDVYGLDVGRKNFDFSSLDIEIQQQIEADFDAQFTSENGDRIESWEELAQTMYGTDFESLTEEQQQVVKEQYDEQFV